MELTIRDAAERLGVSSDTIRRRLKAGELDGRQEPQGKQGYRWIVQLPDDAQDTPTAVGTAAPGMPTAMAYELADSRARIEGLERLIDEIGSQREKLERERDDWKDAAQREGEASRELRHLLKQSQDLALPAQASPQARTEPLELTHGPQHPEDVPQESEHAVSAWERIRRLFMGG
jgi:predicted DNA-binding transcriptional regulator YafY